MRRVVSSLPFRTAIALGFLVLHLVAFLVMARERFGLPFLADERNAPAFTDARTLSHWNRFVVSRWDSEHYLGLALRLYSECPATDLAGADLTRVDPRCDLSFYPGYGVLGRLVSLGGRLPVDCVLLGISLVSSLSLMLMWTSKSVTDKLGLGPTYLSLVLFNAFTTGFTLVTLQTEPALLACSFGVYIALERRWFWLAAVLAGAASGLRVSGIGAAVACGLALVANALTDRPRVWRTWASVGLLLPVCGWGFCAIMLYDHWRFHDALVYFHSHAQNYHHGIGLHFGTEQLFRSFDSPLHVGWFLTMVLLLFAIGHRRGLRPFDPVGRVYWYGLVVVGVGIGVLGSAEMAFSGMNRYMLIGIPFFFVLARLMYRKVAVTCLWLALNMWHYWQADLCFFVADRGPLGYRKCHAAHWIDK